MISECFEGELSEEGGLWGIKWSQVFILDSKINIIYAFFSRKYAGKKSLD